MDEILEGFGVVVSLCGSDLSCSNSGTGGYSGGDGSGGGRNGGDKMDNNTLPL